MNMMEMMQEMSRRIEADEALAISEWQGSFHFEHGAPTKSSLVNLNEIDIPGSPDMPEGKMTAVEMLIASLANCYATTLHKNAFTKKIPLAEVQVEMTGKFDLRPFLGLSDGHPGIIDPVLKLTVTSTADQAAIKDLAEQSLIQSPVIKSLSTDVKLKVES